MQLLLMYTFHLVLHSVLSALVHHMLDECSIFLRYYMQVCCFVSYCLIRTGHLTTRYILEEIE